MSGLFHLDDLDDDALDHLPFGVIRLDPAGRIERFNQPEAARSGIQRWRALGRDYFRDVAQSSDELAATIHALSPGSCTSIEHTFRGYRHATHAMVDVSRSTDGHVYMRIRAA
jgi:PAS domain-containing protein